MNKQVKRLVEVDLPIKRISNHARREKSIRHGHISTMHIWWARRPLAACRAVLCAALWPDPVDPLCGQKFREDACRLINEFAAKAASDKLLSQSCSSDTWKKWQLLAKPGNRLDPKREPHWNVLRFALLDFIADFANWDNATVPEYLDVARALTQSAHESLGGHLGTKPLVVDPFTGGGSIPLEALRVGADAFASDLNPVAVLLNKVLLEYIPKYGDRLTSEVRKWGEHLRSAAEHRLSDYYPKGSDGSVAVSYLWARTVVCEGPKCGTRIPLVRSRWLAEGPKKVAIELKPRSGSTNIDCNIIDGSATKAVGPGTVHRGAATCPACGYTTPAANVRRQFVGRRGGAHDAQLLAVVRTSPTTGAREYSVPTAADLAACTSAAAALEKVRQEGTGRIPEEPLPYLRSIFNIHLLGVTEWGQLFAPRQALAILTLIDCLVETASQLKPNDAFSTAILTCLALAIDRQADYDSSLCRWVAKGEFIGSTFARQALGIIWDFAEVNPMSGATGDFGGAVQWVVKVCSSVSESRLDPGHAERASATRHPLPNDSANLLCTDPPYYDAVPYADLSDFFYVWLKRSIGRFHPELFAEGLTPKEEEVVQLAERNEIYAFKTKERFESLMRSALQEGRRFTVESGLAVIVFAHKSTAAWETMLQAVVDSGWVATASWPIDTERSSRLRSMDSAALASSVHLVCRPRENHWDSSGDSDIGDWRDVLAELPKRIHEWMPRLQTEGVFGADAIFACLGPALEIFSRYSRVEKPNGEQVTLREYLEYVWAAVSKEAISMIFEGADTTGFEEDARLTAMWLWTLSAGPSNVEGTEAGEIEDGDEEADEKPVRASRLTGFSLEYDAARKIAQGLGAHLEQLLSLVEVKGETARLLPVAERTKALFGKEGTESPAPKRKKSAQLALPGLLEELEQEGSGWTLQSAAKPGTTTLDRLHQAMILFAAGRGEALRRFLVDDGVGKDQRFWGLAQSLCALYPSGTDERRWSEGVLARKRGLGL